MKTQHGDSRDKRNVDDVRRTEQIIANVIKINKDSSIRKKPVRKSSSSKSIPIEKRGDREIINNILRSESIENLEFIEANNSNSKVPRTNEYEFSVWKETCAPPYKSARALQVFSKQLSRLLYTKHNEPS